MALVRAPPQILSHPPTNYYQPPQFPSARNHALVFAGSNGDTLPLKASNIAIRCKVYCYCVPLSRTSSSAQGHKILLRGLGRREGGAFSCLRRTTYRHRYWWSTATSSADYVIDYKAYLHADYASPCAVCPDDGETSHGHRFRGANLMLKRGIVTL